MPKDITSKWIETNGAKGSVTMLDKCIFKGTEYIVDGRHVVQDSSNEELKIAEIFANKYGKKVEILPRVLYPQGISTPDYLINGEGFDLKTPHGGSENTLYNMLKSKKKQASNFIVDSSRWGVGYEKINRQIYDVLSSERTEFVKVVIIIENEEEIKAFSR